ncbi:MAG: hypothetical protein MPJ50_05580 [Pirellulales bacterium]|nr:hypothetical protein [Pirellulales bacterium]
MSEGDFFRYLIAQLERHRLAYMVSGSVASSFHGEPRTSFDIDIVVEGTVDQIAGLCRELDARCYVSPNAAQTAVREHGMFNVIDSQSGIKADLILRKDRPFSEMEFQRRQQVEICGVSAFLVSAEDSILSKLEWANFGESDRQYRDALNIATGESKTQLDLSYLRHWAEQLNVADALARLIKESGLR